MLATSLMTTTPLVLSSSSSLSEDTRLATAGKAGAAWREVGVASLPPDLDVLLLDPLRDAREEEEVWNGRQNSSDMSV